MWLDIRGGSRYAIGLFLKREDQAFISGQSEPTEKAIPIYTASGSKLMF